MKAFVKHALGDGGQLLVAIVKWRVADNRIQGFLNRRQNVALTYITLQRVGPEVFSGCEGCQLRVVGTL